MCLQGQVVWETVNTVPYLKLPNATAQSRRQFSLQLVRGLLVHPGPSWFWRHNGEWVKRFCNVRLIWFSRPLPTFADFEDTPDSEMKVVVPVRKECQVQLKKNKYYFYFFSSAIFRWQQPEAYSRRRSSNKRFCFVLTYLPIHRTVRTRHWTF